jgi:predicted DNA-binding transcriptional regulator AlpA
MTARDALSALVQDSPAGALLTVPRNWLAEVLQPATTPAAVSAPTVGDNRPAWRERLWTCPAETRLGVAEVAEAIGRPKSFVYRATSAKSIPHRKLDGELVFVASEIRQWIRDQEETVTTARGIERAVLTHLAKEQR